MHIKPAQAAVATLRSRFGGYADDQMRLDTLCLNPGESPASDIGRPFREPRPVVLSGYPVAAAERSGSSQAGGNTAGA
jgi:hypothetical protein